MDEQVVKTYAMGQVCELTGCTYRQLDYWVRSGYVVPIGDAAPGTGYRREFGADEVRLIRALVRLSTMCTGAVLGSMANVLGRHLNGGLVQLGRGVYANVEELTTP